MIELALASWLLIETHGNTTWFTNYLRFFVTISMRPQEQLFQVRREFKQICRPIAPAFLSVERADLQRNQIDMNTPRFEILTKDMGGWVRVYLGHGEPTGEVAVFLSRTLADWSRKHPQLRIRFIVPISSNGDTSELHAWYDQVLFPDTSEEERTEGDW